MFWCLETIIRNLHPTPREALVSKGLQKLSDFECQIRALF